MVEQPIVWPLDEEGPPRLNPVYAEMREKCPVARATMPYGEETWLTVNHADFKTVMTDSRFSRALAHASDEPRVFVEMPDINIMRMDPPEHTRIRKVVSRGFTERRVAGMRPKIQQIVDDLLDKMEDAGPPVNFVTAFGTPLPVAVIAIMLGVPEEDRPLFVEWSKSLIATTSMPVEQIQQYFGNLHQYVAGMVADRKNNPRDDVISDLTAILNESDEYTEDEIIVLGMFLLATGHGSTANQISYGQYVLFSNPEQWKMLVADPSLARTTADELLRYGNNDEGANFSRYAKEDVMVGGTLIKKGEPVMAGRVAANYDPVVFKDPERLDITRNPNPHVTFGAGIHFCPGAALSRAQIQIAFESLVKRFPTLYPAQPLDELVWHGGNLNRAFRELLVAW